MKTSVEVFASSIDLNTIPNYGIVIYLLIGILLTALMQSSSATIAVVLTTLYTGVIDFNAAAAMVIGSNIGTTITALIASFFISTDAITIASIHVLFNFVGFLLFMLIPWARHLAIYLAIRFGNLAATYRLLGLAYIVLIFFVVPFALIYLTQ